MSGHLDLDELFEAVLDQAESLFAADSVGIWLLEPGDHPFRFAAGRRLSEGIVEAVAAIDREADTPGLRAIRSRAVLVIGPDEAAAPAITASYARDGIKSICFVPIVFRDDPLGVLVLYHRRPRSWSAEERTLARGFADEMAAAIQNARLYASVRDLAARLEAIGDLSLRLNRIQGIEAIGESIVAEASALIDHDTIRVYRIDEARQRCIPIAWSGRFTGVEETTADLLEVGIGEGLTGWVAATGETILSGDAGHDPRTIIVGEDDEPESMLIVPMRYEDRVCGLVVVSKVGTDRFTADDEAILSIFAAYAAQALVNAERAERVHDQQRELEVQLVSQRRLLEVTERLVSRRDPGAVLESIADALKELVWYDTLSLYLIDRARGTRRAVVARDRFAEVILEYEAPLGTGLTGWVVSRGEATLANDAHLDPRTTQIPGTPEEPESMIVVPLIVAGEVVGTLNIGRIGAEEAHFSPHEFELTKLFAAQASLALQNAEAHRAAEVRARHDALTGLRNHGAFQADLAAALADADGSIALLMLDLDGFKLFNDTHGHPAGDALLRRFAEALESTIRDGDTAYRYGGDEFAVILPGVDRVGALEVADRIRRTVAELPTPEVGPRLGVSIGLACSPEEAASKDDLLATADRALYLAKPVRAGEGTGDDPRDFYLAALNETALALMDRLEPRDLLEAILARATALLGTIHGFIYLLDPADDMLVVEVGTGVFGGFLGFRLPRGEGLSGAVLGTGRPMVIDDYDGWSGRATTLPTGMFGSVAAVPLTSGANAIGVLGLASGGSVRAFNEREIAVLSRLAQLASIALDNARLFDAAQREVLERARAEAALRASEERFRRLSDAAVEALAIHRDGRILEVNQSFRTLFGCTDDEAVGRPLTSFVAWGSRARLGRRLKRADDGPVEVTALSAGGERFPVLIAGRSIPFPDGPARVASIRDLRERRQLEERLAHQARTDRVTGLPNREELTERLATVLSRDATPGRAALVLLDIDRFRVINERFGHAAGDELLAGVGQRLVDALRPGDTVARFGGDEFGLIVEGIQDADGALAVAERLAADLREPFQVGGHEAFVAARMGIVLVGPGGRDPGDAFRDVEIALHRAKSASAQGYAIFDPLMSAEMMERLDLEAELRGAIARDELRLHYQPIVDLANGAIVGVEALLRWQHPRHGLIPPGRFIPVAEETGLILPIGRWVLETACRQARSWAAAAPGAAPLTVSVNLSPQQFEAEDIVTLVRSVLRRTSTPPALLELEITESVLMARPESAVESIRALRDLGVRFSLDDFGTGYSSLGYLKHLPIDRIKVDRTFVAELGEDRAAESIVSAVVSLAHGLGIEVIAEGIETGLQLDRAVALGCDHGQGFLFATPVAADALVERLEGASLMGGGAVGTDGAA